MWRKPEPAGLVFISYATVDRRRLLGLLAALRAAGFMPWVDRHYVRLRTYVAREIATALRHSACVLLIWSRHTRYSRWVVDEVARARRLGLAVVALCEEATLPPSWLGAHAAFRVPSNGDYRRIIAAIRHLSRPSAITRRRQSGARLS